MAQFRETFKRILKDEKRVDKSRDYLLKCEKQEDKIRSKMHEANKNGTREDIQMLQEKLNKSKETLRAAQVEVSGKTSELELLKIKELKDSLILLSDCHLELANKTNILYQAQKVIAKNLPDINGRSIENITYSGLSHAKDTVRKVQQRIRSHQVPSYDPPEYPHPPGFLSPPRFSPPPYNFSVYCEAPPFSPDSLPPDLRFN